MGGEVPRRPGPFTLFKVGLDHPTRLCISSYTDIGLCSDLLHVTRSIVTIS